MRARTCSRSGRVELRGRLHRRPCRRRGPRLALLGPRGPCRAAATGGLLPDADVVLAGHHGCSRRHDCQKPGEAVRQAGRLHPARIPSRPRRARHLIEVARGHYGKGDNEAVMATLRQAYDSAPETIRYLLDRGLRRGLSVQQTRQEISSLCGD